MVLKAALSKNPESPGAKVHSDDFYFPISPDILNPDALTDFQVFLKHNGRYVLYTKKRQCFSEALKQRLIENDIHAVYIPHHQQSCYESYLFDNLEWILRDASISVDTRSRVFLGTTARQVSTIFENKAPALDERTLGGLQHVVGASLSFLSTPEAIESIGRFISHDYKTFLHSVNVFTYTMMLMGTLVHTWEEESLIDIGVGALLHDIGKMHVPVKVLNKRGSLNTDEWRVIRLHPVQAMRMCTHVALPQMSLNCMLFHHEKFDGTGYPTGMRGEEIPLPVRIITCCDVYDALTSNRPYASARTPAEALKIMSLEMKNAFDPEVFQSFVKLLGATQK